MTAEAEHQNVKGAGAKRLDVAIVGAGLSGLYALHLARKNGWEAEIFEMAEDLGGTWYWNRYPGARCDVESREYSYSFSDEIQQEWRWTERHATQPEILRYINHVADRLDLRRSINFGLRVERATFDEGDDHPWQLEFDEGTVVRARFCLMAVGCLSLPRVPAFEGLEGFEGDVYHTGNWPHVPVSFDGRRVGVIGTGSSGIQLIPFVAETASHLHVFQRTPNYSLPARNAAVSDEDDARNKAEYDELRALARRHPVGIGSYPMVTTSGLAIDDEERNAHFERGWAAGSTLFTRLFPDMLLSEELNAMASEFVRVKIGEIVEDPQTAADLQPRDHFIGTKRLCLGSNYYETFNRDNVTLVNLRRTPIETITAKGIQLVDRHVPLDAIVFATGFDAVTGPFQDIDVSARGQTLRDKWTEGPKVYLGFMPAGFPNLFLVTGPSSPSVLTNMAMAIEQHVEWIFDCLGEIRRRGAHLIEAEASAEEAWIEHTAAVAEQTLLPTANSWYMGANIPGKPRVMLAYAGGLGSYREICDEVAKDGYRGFKIT